MYIFKVLEGGEARLDPSGIKPVSMISEGNKVFAIVKGTAEGMDTMFGHYFEVEDDKMKVMMTFDDTLTAFNATIK